MKLETWLFTDKHALHGAAASRILAGLAVLGLLATNFTTRDVLLGPASSWAEPARSNSSVAQVALVDGQGSNFVSVFYLLTMVAAALFVLGWHTRTVGLLTLIGHTALIEHNPVVGDQGDNILRIGLFWLVLMNTSQVWSVDARRSRRRWSPLWLSNVVHNTALSALAAQVLIVYVAAALFKLQGTLWRDGTALYYPLQLPTYRPFPWASDLLTDNELVLAAATYVAMGIQLMFVLMLLTKSTRRIALIVVVLLHVAIAVLMGLPWFSLSMVAFDAIFIGTATYVRIDHWFRQSRWFGVPRRSRRSPEQSAPLLPR